MRLLPLLAAVFASSSLVIAAANADPVDVSAYNVNFGNLGTPVTINLAAGTYNISYNPNGQYQGWDAWSANFGQSNQGPAVSGCSASGGSCAVGWLDSFGYTVNGAAGSAGSVQYLGPAGTYNTSSGQAFASAAQAFAAYSAALGNDTFSLANASAVTFYVPDYGYNVDNYGGLSLQVNAVPEPSSMAAFGSALLVLLFLAARRRRLV